MSDARRTGRWQHAVAVLLVAAGIAVIAVAGDTTRAPRAEEPDAASDVNHPKGGGPTRLSLHDKALLQRMAAGS